METSPTSSDQIFTTLHQFIIQEFGHKYPDIEINADTQLMETGILDSLALSILILFIDDEFGILIPDHMLLPKHFETLPALTNVVMQLSLEYSQKSNGI
jgi:acyl carrier protein